jgi:hypothetical protein
MELHLHSPIFLHVLHRYNFTCMPSLQNSVAYLNVTMATNFSSFSVDYYSSEFSSIRIGYPYSNELCGLPR